MLTASKADLDANIAQDILEASTLGHAPGPCRIHPPAEFHGYPNYTTYMTRTHARLFRSIAVLGGHQTPQWSPLVPPQWSPLVTTLTRSEGWWI